MTQPPRLPDPRMIPSWDSAAWFVPEPGTEAADDGGPAQPDAGPEPEQDGRDDSFLRPFILTQGRTRPLHDGLRIETLIMASPAALSAPTQHERRRIVEICQQPLSLAEVAVALAVPLGVARVLIADLVADNLVTLREPTELPLNVVERIYDLVRQL
jgi:Protein of unknown function (DUF742)